MSQIYTILFDLDGTIVNTAPDLMAAHNHVMRKFGHSEKNCFAKTDVNGKKIIDGEEILSWECKFCGKEFDTEKGCMFHENVHCTKRRGKNSYRNPKKQSRMLQDELYDSSDDDSSYGFDQDEFEEEDEDEIIYPLSSNKDILNNESRNSSSSSITKVFPNYISIISENKKFTWGQTFKRCRK